MKGPYLGPTETTLCELGVSTNRGAQWTIIMYFDPHCRDSQQGPLIFGTPQLSTNKPRLFLKHAAPRCLMFQRLGLLPLGRKPMEGRSCQSVDLAGFLDV